MEELHISTLRIEPHRVRPPHDWEYYGPTEGALFWKIFADETLITEAALPFLPTAAVVELLGNIQFPYPGDGGGDVSVRRLESYVIWMDLLDTDVIYRSYDEGHPFLGKVIIYDADMYTTVINEALKNLVHPDNLYIHRPAAEAKLPEMSSKDLRAFLSFPDPELALYRTPKREHDNLGAMVLRRVMIAVHEELDSVCVSEPPDQYTELRIGFDEPPDFYESVWHIGKTEQGVAIRFVERPYFPFWLCGAAFDKALGSEPFLQS